MKSRPPGSVEQVALRCLRAVRKELGSDWKLVTGFLYFDAEGAEVMQVLRFQSGDGAEKTFRPIHKTPGGWACGDPPAPLPLYRLPDLLKEDVICLFEGEGVAEEASDLGVVATTSAHGAASASKTDWKPLAGK